MRCSLRTFLTVFNTKKVHLQKDVGMIPYCLSKFFNWKCALTYLDNRHDANIDYKTYVDLLKISTEKCKCLQWFSWYCDIIQSSRKYCVINFYHYSLKKSCVLFLIKMFNSQLILYCKMDMNEYGILKLQNANKDILTKFKNILKKSFINRFVDVFSVECSAFYKELIKDEIMKRKLLYLPNGFLIKKEYEKFFLIKKEKIILTVGRIGAKEKNTELLIEAIKKIPESKLSDWKVYLVGPIEEGFLEYIDGIVREYEYMKNLVVVTGNIVEKEKLYTMYAKAKIFCLSSNWEGFPLVIPEAMYFKNYVITTNFPAAYDLTASGTCGKIVERENVREMQEAIEECLDENVDMESIGALAHQRVVDQFNWEKIAKKLADVLEELMQQKKDV